MGKTLSERRFLMSVLVDFGINPKFTERGQAVAIFESIAAMEVPDAHEAAVAALVRDAVSTLRHTAATAGSLSDSLLLAEARQLLTAIRFGGFTTAPVAVDEVARLGPALFAIFDGAEIDIVRTLTANGAPIGDFDAAGITIGGRRYSRYELREAGRPQSWSNVSRWHAQFSPLDGSLRAR
jgi:hypothetical protein